MTQRFCRLRSERILDYVTRLSMRVTERFPNHGLAAVCRELQQMTEMVGRRQRDRRTNHRPIAQDLAKDNDYQPIGESGRGNLNSNDSIGRYRSKVDALRINFFQHRLIKAAAAQRVRAACYGQRWRIPLVIGALLITASWAGIVSVGDDHVLNAGIRLHPFERHGSLRVFSQ